MNLAIFCVTYNTYDETLQFLASIDHAAESARGVNVDVFVGDNTECGVRKIAFSPQRFSLRVYYLHKNWGYFGAVSRMMEQEDTSGYDFVVISNVDVALDANFISQLAQQNTAENVGWIAPQIYSIVEKRDRNPQIVSRYSKRKLQLLHLLFRFPLLHILYTRTAYKAKRLHGHRPGFFYAGHGSFIVLTRQYMERCGTFHHAK